MAQSEISSAVDVWRVQKTSTVPPLEVVVELMHQRFRVCCEAPRETVAIPICLYDLIDWDSKLAQAPSSMLMPVRVSAVGDDGRVTAGDVSALAVRQVLGVSFPSLCLMLMASHSAAELEAAFERMPLVRRGKEARGYNKKAESAYRTVSSGPHGPARRPLATTGGTWEESE